MKTTYNGVEITFTTEYELRLKMNELDRTKSVVTSSESEFFNSIAINKAYNRKVAELNTAKFEISKLKVLIEKFEIQIQEAERIKDTISTLELLNKDATTNIANLEAQNKLFNKKLSEEKHNNVVLTKELEVVTDTLISTKSTLKVRDSKIEELNNRLIQKDDQLIKKDNLIKSKDELIKVKSNELEDTLKEIEKLKLTVAERDRVILELKESKDEEVKIESPEEDKNGE